MTDPHAHRQSHSHTLIHKPEEINDCDLLHLIAHKPGPSTCSNNFWLSHLSRFASMRAWAASMAKSRATSKRTNIWGFQCRQSIYGRRWVWPSATDASLKPISMRDMTNRPTRGCQTATTAVAVACTIHCPLYIWFIWFIANKFESSKVLQINLKFPP